MRGERIKRRGVGDLPAVERRALVLVGMDDDALLAVVHAQRQRATALIDELHAEKPRAIGGPIFQIPGADTDIAERIEIHEFNPRVDPQGCPLLLIIWRLRAACDPPPFRTTDLPCFNHPLPKTGEGGTI